MARFYLPASEWAAPSWELRGDEAHHAAKVLRLKQGDSCVVFDGRGRAAHAVVAEPPRSSGVLLAPGEECPPAPELAHLTLCQAVPKGANMDLIIQKSVELGVSAIVPLLTDRTIVRLNAREAEAKRQKWQRIALEACKQCGQNTLPEVASPVPFAEWLRRGAPEGLNVIASLVPGVRRSGTCWKKPAPAPCGVLPCWWGRRATLRTRRRPWRWRPDSLPLRLAPSSSGWRRPPSSGWPPCGTPWTEFFPIRIPMFKNLIFDWSGTLVDDLALTLDASNYVFSQYGKPCMDRDEFRAEFPASLSGLLCPRAAPGGFE